MIHPVRYIRMVNTKDSKLVHANYGNFTNVWPGTYYLSDYSVMLLIEEYTDVTAGGGTDKFI